MIESYTHSCLSCFRRCPREFDLRYLRQLEREGDEREVLQVGTTWHRAHDARSKVATGTMTSTFTPDEAAYATITAHAPGALWAEKLRRLFAAYAWKWASSPFEILQSEHAFEYTKNGSRRRGQIDGIIRIGNRVGNLERKTSGEDIDPGSPYWERQRMGAQVSVYANAFQEIMGHAPNFTLYDVVRKPTIRPKSLVKKDVTRLRAELTVSGVATYFGEEFDATEIEAALADGRETARLYGARLTADIGDRPDFYFQRQVIDRTNKDLDDAEADTDMTISMIESLDGWFPRNPDACATFGLCDFFGLCSNGEYPDPSAVPAGFQRREHLHPELPHE